MLVHHINVLDAAVGAGIEHRFETVTDDVAKLTGRAPIPFRTVVQRASGLKAEPPGE